MLGKVDFDSLNFSFANIELLRCLNWCIGDAFVDEGYKASSLLMLAVGTMSGVVWQGWSLVLLLEFCLLDSDYVQVM